MRLCKLRNVFILFWNNSSECTICLANQEKEALNFSFSHARFFFSFKRFLCFIYIVIFVRTLINFNRFYVMWNKKKSRLCHFLSLKCSAVCTRVIDSIPQRWRHLKSDSSYAERRPRGGSFCCYTCHYVEFIVHLKWDRDTLFKIVGLMIERNVQRFFMSDFTSALLGQ